MKRVRHKLHGWEGHLVHDDGRLALVKWDNQSPALLIALDELEALV